MPRKPRFFLPEIPVHIVQRGQKTETDRNVSNLPQLNISAICLLTSLNNKACCYT